VGLSGSAIAEIRGADGARSVLETDREQVVINDRFPSYEWGAFRHAVLWRKSSGGTAGDWRSRFVGRLLSVAATCRQSGRKVQEYRTGCFDARLECDPLPSLPAHHAAVSQF
jgi:hypothetical protein